MPEPSARSIRLKPGTWHGGGPGSEDKGGRTTEVAGPFVYRMLVTLVTWKIGVFIFRSRLISRIGQQKGPRMLLLSESKIGTSELEGSD